MKQKIIALLICIICITTGYAQNFSTQLSRSVDTRNVSIVTVNSSMLESLRRRETNPAVRAFLADLNFLRIMTVDNPRNAATFYRSALSLLEQNDDFEELLAMEEGRQRVVIAALTPEDDKTTEIVMISYITNASLTIVNITGNIDISDLSQLATTIRNLR